MSFSPMGECEYVKETRKASVGLKLISGTGRVNHSSVLYCVHCALQTAYFQLHPANNILSTAHCTLYTVHFALHNVNYTQV